MLSHLAPPVTPSDVWRSWSTDPVLWAVLGGAVMLHTRGWRSSGRQRWRRWAFLAAVAVSAVALVSPLDALSSTLASAHMAQHLVLTLVVAPLLVVAAPAKPLLRGLPRSLRVELRHLRRAGWLHIGPIVRARPIAAAVLHAVVLWLWHAGSLYELALRNDLAHRAEHLTFLATAWCAWAAVLLTGRRAQLAGIGLGPLVLFGLSVQGAILGALMTFAREPWYPVYGDRGQVWGMTLLEDQQLAGLLMWVPAGAVFLVAALALLVTSIMRSDPDADSPRGLGREPIVATRSDPVLRVPVEEL